jgi:hypothetical protein
MRHRSRCYSILATKPNELLGRHPALKREPSHPPLSTCDQTKRVARPTSRPKTRTIPSAFVDVALDSPSMFNSEICTLVHLSANTPLISPGGHFFWKCFLTETENDNKRSCARQQAAPRQMKLNLSNATHRVSPAGRRPPAAGKLAVGAARRMGGDARGGA